MPRSRFLLTMWMMTTTTTTIIIIITWSCRLVKRRSQFSYTGYAHADVSKSLDGKGEHAHVNA